MIYVDDLEVWKRVGRQETTGNPNYAIAYKSPSFTDLFETKVKGITWKISKSGAIKPVVNIETVSTGDCEIENPTGYNANYIFTNNIGPGAELKITRSGGVIPKIIEIVKPATAGAMKKMADNLAKCPECGEQMRWNESHSDLTHSNPDCPGIRLAKIIHFYSVLEAENMGEETISRIFNAGYKSLNAILQISFDELNFIEGIGESIANAILATNQRILNGVESTKLMHASDCFEGIGQVKARKILMSIPESERYLFENGLLKLSDNFEDLPEFKSKSKTIQSFVLGIKPFYDFIAENKLVIMPMEAPAEPTNDKYAGMKVCFTGIRDKILEEEIMTGGGEIVGGVSKKTTHLIVADKNGSSHKISRAKQLGVTIMTIDEFRSL